MQNYVGACFTRLAKGSPCAINELDPFSSAISIQYRRDRQKYTGP